MIDKNKSIHLTIVATPDAQISPMSGLYETFNSFGLLSNFEPNIPKKPFKVDIVAPNSNFEAEISGLNLSASQVVGNIKHTDIVIVPLMMVKGPNWVIGRYPGVVNWLRKMYSNGSIMCSTCTGILLLAETGLLDGKEATIHWAFAPTFKRNFPGIHLLTEEVLITAGKNHEFVMTGGVMSWHDLALYLIARFVGPTAAKGMAKLLMLQWHSEGQAPYISFSQNLNHDDALIIELQNWLKKNYSTKNPVEEIISRSGLSNRSLGRRFIRATGYSPIAYVQNLRIEEARRQLERTTKPVEEIIYQVGYENVAFFRRIFKRTTKLTPALYRRKFKMPTVKEGKS